MKRYLLLMFTWWQGTTVGTNWHTAKNGERVGSDEFGNVYYRTRGGKIDKLLGFQRRWVIYAGQAEASKIPPGWHGWMHHRTDVAPSDETYEAWPWEIAHQANGTGSPNAYRPKGSILGSAIRQPASSDYGAWKPE
jgi:NADH:ubiquinone oxidoreductase subunit